MEQGAWRYLGARKNEHARVFRAAKYFQVKRLLQRLNRATQCALDMYSFLLTSWGRGLHMERSVSLGLTASHLKKYDFECIGVIFLIAHIGRQNRVVFHCGKKDISIPVTGLFW